MKISELKQPYRAIAEWDAKIFKEDNIHYLRNIDWGKSKVGVAFYHKLIEGLYPEITDQIKADYKEVFDKLEAEEFVKGEIVEVLSVDEWFKATFIADIKEYTKNNCIYICLTGSNHFPCAFSKNNIRKLPPVTTLTLDEVKKKLNIEGELIIK
jgi:hypothetical protein